MRDCFLYSYRFGFNGMEKDDEVFGSTGTSYTAEFWQYDSRLGRRWNVDPLASKASGWTPYRAFFDNPVRYTDPNGAYEADGSLSKKEKSAIKSKHKDKGGDNWRKDYKQEVSDKVDENVNEIEKHVADAQNLLESNPQALDVFEKLTGTIKGDKRYNRFFENDGKGFKLKINNLETSGKTDQFGRRVIISSSGLSNYGIQRTILHEYIHVAGYKYIAGDRTSNGYKNFYVGKTLITKQTQLDNIFKAKAFYNDNMSKIFDDTYMETGNLNEKKESVTVEGGYLFDIYGFGNIVSKKGNLR